MLSNLKRSVLIISCLMLTTVNGLTLGVPVNKTIGATTTVSFTSSPNDPPSWTLYLSKENQIWAYYGTLATPVDPSPGIVTITIPSDSQVIPATEYVLKAVYVDNFDWVIAQSPAFILTA